MTAQYGTNGMSAAAGSEPRSSRVLPSDVFRVERRPDGLARVVYDVPGERVNTLKPSFAGDFEALLRLLESDSTLVGAVFISGKPDSWVAGADLSMLKGLDVAEAGEALSAAGLAAFARLAACPKPIVAAIHGPALGGGFELALACHGRVLSKDERTVFGLPEVKLGLLPGLGGAERVAEKAGLQVALDLALTGKPIGWAKARRLGLADDVVERPLLEEAAAELAHRLSRGTEGPAPGRRIGDRGSGRKVSVGRTTELLARAAIEKTPLGRRLLFAEVRKQTRQKSRGHYPAPEKIVDVLEAFAKGGFERSSPVASRGFGALVVSPAARELMGLFFATTALKKEPPVEEPDARPAKVESVAVVGAGLMGSGIALACLDAGLRVRMKDRDDEHVLGGVRSVAQRLGERVEKHQMSRAAASQRLARLTTSLDDSGVAGADLVVEAVFEDLACKQVVLREIEPRMKEGAVFATNTSALPIAEIARAAARPERVVGMHYFSPVHKMRLLEVVRGPASDPRAVATAVEVGRRQGKTVIVVRDGPGFYTTRLLAPYLNEACWLVKQGADVEAVDRALAAWGWPVGPLALLDEVGIDVAAHVVSTVGSAFAGRLDAPDFVSKLVQDQRLGRKNRRGLYLYPEKGAEKRRGKRADDSVYAALGLDRPRPEGVSVEEMQSRCVLAFVNEAVRCLGEGIIRSCRDGDVAAVLGLGFPPFRGGPFRWIDSEGPAEVLRRLRELEQRWGPRFAPAPLLLEKERAGGRFYA